MNLVKRTAILLLVVFFAGCGGGGGGEGGVSVNIPLKRVIWEQEMLYGDGSTLPDSDLQGFLIYVQTDNTFLDDDPVSDEVDTSYVLTGVDNNTGTVKLNCEYDLRNAYYKNNLNLTDNYFVAIRSVTVYGGVSSFTVSVGSFSFSGK